MPGVWSMTGQELSDRADKIAENSWLKLIGRFSMIGAMPVVATGSFWIGSVLWSINNEQGKLSARIDVLTERIGTSVIRSADVDLGFKLRDQRLEYLEKSGVDMRQTIRDHEDRIRKIEQK